MKLSDITESIFQELDQTINVLDHSAVNTVSAFAPWLVPVAPAIIAYNRLVNVLHFDGISAISVALVIEFIGISAVSTTLQFWKHNRQYKTNRVPVLAPFLSALFYLFVILSVNVLLEVPQEWVGGEITKILAISLISTLSIPASVLLGSRFLYREIQEKLNEERKERKEQKKLKIVSVKSNRQSRHIDIPANVTGMSVSEIASQMGVSERTVYRRLAKVGKNGNGE